MWFASLRTLGMSYRIFLEWAKFSTVWSMVHVFTTISRMVCTCVKLTVQLGSSLGTKEELREAAGWSCPRASSLYQSLQLRTRPAA